MVRVTRATGRTRSIDYLRAHILDPTGLRVGSWRTLKDGTQPLPTGAFVAAGEWLKFGEFVSAGGVHQGKRS